MRKLIALLFSFGLLAILFGSILVSGAHKLVHIVDEPAGVAHHSNAEAHGHAHVHDHGHGSHSHGSTMAFLLESFDYSKLALPLKGVENALQWMLQLPGIFEAHSVSLDLAPPTELSSAETRFLGFHDSTPVDIPTPPPKPFLA